MNTYEVKTQGAPVQKIEAESFTIKGSNIVFNNGDELVHSVPLYSASALEFIREVES